MTKPIIINRPLPGQAVDEYLKKYGHLPNETMKPIRPESNYPSSIVTRKLLKRVLPDARILAKMIDDRDFEGNYHNAMALAHCQYFKEPLQFFVVNNQISKVFDSRIIINPRLSRISGELKKNKEACFSYPFRNPTSTYRYTDIEVEYRIPFLRMFLKKKKKSLKGELAIMVQHEIQHFIGESPYS